MGNSVKEHQIKLEDNQILTSEISAAQVKGASAHDKHNTGNILLYVVLLLAQAVGIQSDASVIKAKQLQANASNQMRLEKLEGNISWKRVPTAQVVTDKYTKSSHYVWSTDGAAFPWLHDKKDYAYTHHTANVTDIDQANAENFNGNAIRQSLQGKISILQQTAGIAETGVSELVQFSNESTQKASYVLSMIEDLTNKALLHG